MDQERINTKINMLETRIQALETSWRREKFKAEREITRRWEKKERIRANRLTIKVSTEYGDRMAIPPREPEYKLAEFIKDAVKWNSLIKKGLIYRRGDGWYVRKTLAEDGGFLVLEV
ncbi:hypothetical protein CW696_07875 [ANME-2 cluster archaeon]|nr:MAG: hypothetical protein CW696_07875 [ANME-2 cluster archaeon]RLB67089.1 MAG: hypothetical protein DRH04_08485 [Deltaproteobacteria bacterium]